MSLSQQSAVSWQGQEQEPGFGAVAVGGQRWKAAGQAWLACLPKAGRQAQDYLALGGLAGEECLSSGRKGAANRLCVSALLRAEPLRCAPCCCCPRGAAQGRLCRWQGPGANGASRARPGRGAGAAGLPGHGTPLQFAPCPQPPLPCGNPALPHSSTRAVPKAGPAGPWASEPPGPARRLRRSR